MLLAGDEFGRTQGGNNNAYCQDNEISWIDWTLATQPPGSELHEFTRRLARLRRKLPLLHRGRYLHAGFDEDGELSEIRWISPAGVDLTPEQWQDTSMLCLGMILDGRARESNLPRPGHDATLLWIVNAYQDAVEFTLPELPGGSHWACLIDTNRPSPPGLDSLPVCQSREVFTVTGRSTLLFAFEADGETGALLDRLREDLTGE